MYTQGLIGFEIAGRNQELVTGEVRIDGATVVVRSGNGPYPPLARGARGLNPWPIYITALACLPRPFERTTKRTIQKANKC